MNNWIIGLWIVILFITGSGFAQADELDDEFPDNMVFVERVRLNPDAFYRYVIVKVRTELGVSLPLILEPTVKCKWLYRHVQSNIYIEVVEDGYVLISPDGDKCFCFKVDVVELLEKKE